jgi:periplasmic protein TonB
MYACSGGFPDYERPSTSVTCCDYWRCLVSINMGLRCLLFSSNQEEIQPVWEVLPDLGVEGEFCGVARDAIQRVATETFQIVIADWAEQPEAAILLKTARGQKAANRPLSLAIVNEDSQLPEALRAGANSVLVRPLRTDAVRDTLKTACQILQSKQAAAPVGQKSAAAPPARAIAASAGAGSGQVYVGAPVTSFMPTAAAKAEDKKLRAGEFLQSSVPASQFDTESDLHTSGQMTASEVDALTELEPTASAVQDPEPGATEPQASPARGKDQALTGWASLQARLTQNAPPPVPESAKEGSMLGYGETPSFGAAAAPAKAREKLRAELEEKSEAALHAYIDGAPIDGAPGNGEQPEAQPEATTNQASRRRTLLCLGALAVALTVLVAVPRTRQSLLSLTAKGARMAENWMNPKPVPLPEPVPLHDSFGQSGDEYKLPVAENIPDATTDPSQIRIVPGVDPTAKSGKNGDGLAASDQSATAGNTAGANVAVAENGAAEAGSSSQAPAETSPAGSVAPPPATMQVSQPALPVSSPEQQAHATTPMQPRGNSSAGNSAIPSSLRSQTASSTPEASGAKPEEAAMSSIEPVVLPETTAWTQLAQPVDAVYPPNAAGQRGSVLLQVLIARDGAVQDAKFVQGSLVFARAAIDAVKQWKFKPYLLNGRAVQVQSTITLNFKPPA